jgi:large subunit ribosomal protein L13
MNPKTYLPKVAEMKKVWHHIDAEGKALGRVATQAAGHLMGKNKRYYTTHLDCGDFVVITNAAKVVLTGNKIHEKIDYRHSGYPRGDKYVPYTRLMVENPEKAVFLAVKGMLFKNRLGSKMINRLKIFKGPENPFASHIK